MSRLYIKHADTEWFKQEGWYVIDDHMHFHGPYESKATATHEEFRINREIKRDPWSDVSNV